MPPLSVLDLSPIVEGGDAAQSFRNTVSLARHVEALGYRRFWLAEHHSLSGIASAATAVLIGHVAGATSTIRVGAGGIMLPNHAPLVIAEQFGTLGTLYPGRIDLGVGRAPGSDQVTARALRRNLAGDVDAFPQDVLELIGYFHPAEPGQKVVAIPGAGVEVPVWILGSSLYGAQLAAHLGLPYAFASHFAPQQLDQAAHVYRAAFRPSERLDRPWFMPALNVFAADSDAQARLHFTSAQQKVLDLRTGRPGKLPAPVEGFAEGLDPVARTMIDQFLACSVVGAPDTVAEGIAAFAARTGADEIIVTSAFHDHAAQLRSFEILASVAA
jgi:luciferase family oxidoreductase group 1